jgi:hypothetical protein
MNARINRFAIGVLLMAGTVINMRTGWPSRALARFDRDSRPTARIEG